jgi:ABC-type nickel/cobalt efflux system permease component RcnA
MGKHGFSCKNNRGRRQGGERMTEKPIGLILFDAFTIIMGIIVLAMIFISVINMFISWDISRILILLLMQCAILIVFLGIWMIYEQLKEMVEAKE